MCVGTIEKPLELPNWNVSCLLNYNDVFVSLLWGSLRLIVTILSQANNDIKLFYFYVFLLKCLIYSQGSSKDFSFAQPKKEEGGRGEIQKRERFLSIQN